MTTVRGSLAACLFGPLLFAGATRAQISPGPLSAAHAALEGSAHCLDCHRPERGVDPELCLACHGALADRIAAGAGLHARPELARCERCHSEHNGRDFALVHWPSGEAGFAHAETGWSLEGKHAGLGCRKCHRAERVAAAVREREPRTDLDRTYLGLSRECAACHADPHRGTMKSADGERGCAGCHGQESWKASRPFDHATTRFPLDAVHAPVACAKCHRPESPVPAGERVLVFDQFRGRAAPPGCASCHRDPHEGRLGADCARCHSGPSFRQADRRAFDHDRTAYPLRGRHRAVACERCHGADATRAIARFERCESCHRDPHFGQLAEASPACDTCHAVEGWTPARYGLAEHERARFPLAGAHRAVPCSSCHAEAAAAELPPPFRRATAERTRRFRFAAIDCAACHRDPHEGELDRWAGDQGCLACHDLERWRPAAFDHARTRFALAGGHARVACDGCHPRGEAGQRRFAGRPLDCAGCHRDEHAGQLARAGATDCARCHGVERFRPAPGFDHARTRYPLDGAHARVPCASCHPRERIDGRDVVRYSPRPRECAGCHGRTGVPEGRT